MKDEYLEGIETFRNNKGKNKIFQHILGKEIRILLEDLEEMKKVLESQCKLSYK